MYDELLATLFLEIVVGGRKEWRIEKIKHACAVRKIKETLLKESYYSLQKVGLKF